MLASVCSSNVQTATFEEAKFINSNQQYHQHKTRNLNVQFSLSFQSLKFGLKKKKKSRMVRPEKREWKIKSYIESFPSSFFPMTEQSLEKKPKNISFSSNNTMGHPEGKDINTKSRYQSLHSSPNKIIAQYKISNSQKPVSWVLKLTADPRHFQFCPEKQTPNFWVSKLSCSLSHLSE